jgi:L-threonylcarbamoyladenylate synthase
VKLFHAETASNDAYVELASLLRTGGVIGFPTDTSYGLGADPFNEAAVNRIFEIKGRAESKPILLLVESLAMAESIVQTTDVFYSVAQKFWPGPLTLILDTDTTLPANVTAGTETIGVRWPIASFATALLKEFRKPMTATSANRSGMPSAVTADEVRQQLGDGLDALVDGGVLPSRQGSSVLDLTVDPPVLLREGPVTFETLSSFFGGQIRRLVA